MKVRAILVWLVAGQRAPSAGGQRRQNNNNTTVPPQPMGVRGRAVHPPDKQTNNPASTAKLSTTRTANNNAMYFGQPAANRNSCWRNYRATLGRQQQLRTFEQTTQAVGDIANTDSGNIANTKLGKLQKQYLTMRVPLWIQRNGKMEGSGKIRQGGVYTLQFGGRIHSLTLLRHNYTGKMQYFLKLHGNIFPDSRTWL